MIRCFIFQLSVLVLVKDANFPVWSLQSALW